MDVVTGLPGILTMTVLKASGVAFYSSSGYHVRGVHAARLGSEPQPVPNVKRICTLAVLTISTRLHV